MRESATNRNVRSKTLHRLYVDFSDLNEHRFDHNFACGSPNCKCNVGVESTIHYFLHCHLYRAHRSILLMKYLI